MWRKCGNCLLFKFKWNHNSGLQCVRPVVVKPKYLNIPQTDIAILYCGVICSQSLNFSDCGAELWYWGPADTHARPIASQSHQLVLWHQITAVFCGGNEGARARACFQRSRNKFRGKDKLWEVHRMLLAGTCTTAAKSVRSDSPRGQCTCYGPQGKWNERAEPYMCETQTKISREFVVMRAHVRVDVQNHVISAAELIGCILPRPAAPSLTRVLQRLCCCERIWAEHLPLCCSCVKRNLYERAAVADHYYQTHMWHQHSQSNNHTYWFHIGFVLSADSYLERIMMHYHVSVLHSCGMKDAQHPTLWTLDLGFLKLSNKESNTQTPPAPVFTHTHTKGAGCLLLCLCSAHNLHTQLNSVIFSHCLEINTLLFVFCSNSNPSCQLPHIAALCSSGGAVRSRAGLLLGPDTLLYFSKIIPPTSHSSQPGGVKVRTGFQLVFYLLYKYFFSCTTESNSIHFYKRAWP